MLLQLILLTHDGRGAHSLKLSPAQLALALVAAACAVGGALWLGWNIGAFTGPSDTP
jgi:hypothetical protein